MKTLIIDDSRAMRSILKIAIKGIGGGAEMTEAADGSEGLKKLASDGPFDLVLVDWNMPVMNGLEFVKAVRSDPSMAAMKIVMVTTEVEMSQVFLALSAGADEYVMKPFTEAILRDKLRLVGVVTAAEAA